MSKLKFNLKRAPVMSMFIEGLLLFGSFTLDLVIRVNKLFLECDVTKSSGMWKTSWDLTAKVEIKKVY